MLALQIEVHQEINLEYLAVDHLMDRLQRGVQIEVQQEVHLEGHHLEVHQQGVLLQDLQANQALENLLKEEETRI